MEKKNIIILIGVIIFSILVLNYEPSKKEVIKSEPKTVSGQVLKQKAEGVKSFVTNVKNDPYLKEKVNNTKQKIKGFFSKLKRESEGMKKVRESRKEYERNYNVNR